MPFIIRDPRPRLVNMSIQSVIRPVVSQTFPSEENSRPIRQGPKRIVHDDHDLLFSLENSFGLSDDIVSLDHELLQQFPRHVVRHVGIDPGLIDQFDSRNDTAVFFFCELGHHLLDSVERAVHVFGRVGEPFLSE